MKNFVESLFFMLVFIGTFIDASECCRHKAKAKEIKTDLCDARQTIAYLKEEAAVLRASARQDFQIIQDLRAQNEQLNAFRRADRDERTLAMICLVQAQAELEAARAEIARLQSLAPK